VNWRRVVLAESMTDWQPVLPTQISSSVQAVTIRIGQCVADCKAIIWSSLVPGARRYSVEIGFEVQIGFPVSGWNSAGGFVQG
jgi:hypothetical protein